jgi:hypothetical protein
MKKKKNEEDFSNQFLEENIAFSYRRSGYSFKSALTIILSLNEFDEPFSDYKGFPAYVYVVLPTDQAAIVYPLPKRFRREPEVFCRPLD